MRLRGQDEDQIDVRLSIDDFMLLRRVLHEVCNSMHFTDNDFVAIFDTQRGEAEMLLLRTNAIMDRLRLVPEGD
jgi:hypothetical protein